MSVIELYTLIYGHSVMSAILNNPKGYVTIRSNNTLYRVNIDHIMFVSEASNDIRVVLSNGAIIVPSEIETVKSIMEAIAREQSK